MRLPARLLPRRRAVGPAAVTVLTGAVLGLGLAGQIPIALALLSFAAGLGSLWLARQLLLIQRQLAGMARRQALSAQHQQRIMRGLARERSAAQAREHRLRDQVDSGRAATGVALNRLGSQLTRRQRDQTREVEALLQLFNGFTPRAPMPSSGHWALNPTELLGLWAEIERRRPMLVLELGGGVSSVWLGYAVERYGGRLVSVDHDAAYAEQTRTMLRRHRLDKWAEVRVAPLRPLPVGGEPFQWYDPAVFADLSAVDLLLVDGPPGGTGPLARYPALPMLRDRLSTPATVLLDDADRADEREILRRWQAELPRLARQAATLGHLAVLDYPGSASSG